MADNIYDYDITMTCGGCSGAVNRALRTYPGEGSIKNYDVSLETQSAHIVASDDINEGTLHEKIVKTGKSITAVKKNGRSYHQEIERKMLEKQANDKKAGS